MKKLLIVESPHKAKSIGALLSSDYIVKASVGHIRELPNPKYMTKKEKETYTDYAIDVNNNFNALFKVSNDKKKVVEDLKKNLAKCDELILATDPDREGEAISWHLLEVLAPIVKQKNIKVSRATWNEITKKAVTEGLKNKGSINQKEVDSALARQFYDRLFGFSLSPILWKTIAPGTSGGRVQSPALRLIVNREKDRINFVKKEYKTIHGLFDVNNDDITATLINIGERKIATSSSFDSQGVNKNNDLVIDSNNERKIHTFLKKCTYEVNDVNVKPYSRKPQAPYTTSTFQQDVGNRLGLSSKQIMSIAQKLYENSFITYMRSDSVTLSQEAITAARLEVKNLFGDKYCQTPQRVYKNKSKNAQEGHEAIRPVLNDQTNRFNAPKSIKASLDKIDKNAYKIYECIYNRTVATQMIDATGFTTTIKIQSNNTPADKNAVFSTSATTYTELGWMRLTRPVEKDDEDNNTLNDKINKGDVAKLKQLSTKDHTTMPPARFTEPQLVEKLSELGIGRPSTFATIVTINQTRGYVKKNGQQLYPTWLGFKIAQYLEDNIPNFVDYGATALMEDDLDKIGDGSLLRNKFLTTEWKNIVKDVIPLTNNIDWDKVNENGVVDLHNGYQIKVNKFGNWLEDVNSELDDKGNRRGVKLDDTEDIGKNDFTDPAFCKKLYDNGVQAFENSNNNTELGIIDEGPYKGYVVTARTGKYGDFVQAVNKEDDKAKPINHPMPKGVTLDNVNMDKVIELFKEIKLPRQLNANYFVGTGKKGNYIGYKKQKNARKATFKNLPKEFDPRTVTLEEVKKIWDEQ